ncbi:MAG: hypothetical protein NZ954_08970, partial [Thermofilaceae archaeon]|nr:hypothetical protein [Thermofilaceae archaeon]
FQFFPSCCMRAVARLNSPPTRPFNSFPVAVQTIIKVKCNSLPQAPKSRVRCTKYASIRRERPQYDRCVNAKRL